MVVVAVACRTASCLGDPVLHAPCRRCRRRRSRLWPHGGGTIAATAAAAAAAVAGRIGRARPYTLMPWFGGIFFAQ